MTFYITPPSGRISLQKLTAYAETRLKFLCEVYQTNGDRMKLHDIVLAGNTVEESDCLIDGSVKDKISHFILRLASAGNKEMRSFFIAAETLLFDFRFSSMSKDELYKCFRSLDRHIKCLESFNKDMKQILKIFGNIKTDFCSWKRLVHKYLNGEVVDCLSVPFQTVFQLVAKREVVLNKGIARVPVCRLREMVTSLFSQMIKAGTQEAVLTAKISEEDERILQLYRNLRAIYNQRCGKQQQCLSVPWSLTHVDIDLNVESFPPCMSQLHRTLRQQHRLNHHARIQYTLFLKEAGLPVHEALMFWRKEYSQPSNKNNGCCHDWSEEENRYTYNIRHLYGLEGSRVNYRGHSCKSLQEMYIGANCEGGCPFSQFDVTHLYNFMTAEGIHSKQLEIVELSTHGKYSLACELYLRERLKLRHSFMMKTRLKHGETAASNKMSERMCNNKERNCSSQKKPSNSQPFNCSADSLASIQMPVEESTLTQMPCETLSDLCLCDADSTEPVINSGQSEGENTLHANKKCKYCNCSPVEHSDFIPNAAEVKIKDEFLQLKEQPNVDTASDIVSSVHHKPLPDDVQDEETSDLMEARQMLASDLEMTTSCACKSKEDSSADHLSCSDLESINHREVFEDSMTSHSILKPLDYFIKLKGVVEKIEDISY